MGYIRRFLSASTGIIIIGAMKLKFAPFYNYTPLEMPFSTKEPLNFDFSYSRHNNLYNNYTIAHCKPVLEKFDQQVLET